MKLLNSYQQKNLTFFYVKKENDMYLRKKKKKFKNTLYAGLKIKSKPSDQLMENVKKNEKKIHFFFFLLFLNMLLLRLH